MAISTWGWRVAFAVTGAGTFARDATYPRSSSSDLPKFISFNFARGPLPVVFNHEHEETK
jgi:hypothetical protein